MLSFWRASEFDQAAWCDSGTHGYDGRNCAAIWRTETDVLSVRTGGHWASAFCFIDIFSPHVPCPHCTCVPLLKCWCVREGQLEVCILCRWHLCTGVRGIATSTRCRVHTTWRAQMFTRDVCVSRLGTSSITFTLAKPCSYSAVLVLFPLFVCSSPSCDIIAIWRSPEFCKRSQGNIVVAVVRAVWLCYACQLVSANNSTGLHMSTGFHIPARDIWRSTAMEYCACKKMLRIQQCGRRVCPSCNIIKLRLRMNCRELTSTQWEQHRKPKAQNTWSQSWTSNSTEHWTWNKL